jgi:MarR family transcriptional regulator, organic hydroperoxide resistance regulator
VARRTAPRRAPVSVVRSFLKRFRTLDHEFQALSKRMRPLYGITGQQRVVIRIVGQQPDISPGRIADSMKVHPSTLTGLLARLEGRGLIERRIDPSDRRRARCRLTALGRQYNTLQRGTIQWAIQIGLAGIPRAKIQAAEEVLDALSRSVAESSREAPPARPRRKTRPGTALA